ncbi:MAG: hypothetical protein Ct9H300mP1_29600 [Planctomycetaceae bacterium]|nr:MAG: hypothetical protein Ct9H300mP1_29600 [Planctomycetaceae bacterium]
MADRRDLLLLDAELREAWGSTGIDRGTRLVEETGTGLPTELVARFREAHEVYWEAEIDGGRNRTPGGFFDLWLTTGCWAGPFPPSPG